MVRARQALCIVNTRKHARILFDLLPREEGSFHLSAQMCPAHRLAQLATIRKRLDGELPCRVVTTQLIEAGVDIDFPLVLRSQAGIDSIAQAAGRCNREGKIPAAGGQVYVFSSEHQRSERYFAGTAGVGKQILELHPDPLSLAAVQHYFQLYYWSHGDHQWDRKLILRAFSTGRRRAFPFLLNFATCARDFRLIENTQKPVIIPWGEEGQALCDQLRVIPMPPAKLLRRLQRYTVQIPARTWSEHINRQIELIHDQYPVLISPDMHYSQAFGLDLESQGDPYQEV
jgi:CRISPR-associated endonuclease/helicase Cas3